MNVHLLRSPEFNETAYRDLLNLLQSIPGAFNFLASEAEDVTNTYGLKVFEDEDSFIDKVLFQQSVHQYSSPGFEFPVERKIASWTDLFNQCRNYRLRNDIGDVEAVVLLTDITNDMNWFSSWENTANNYFVHTKDWPYFLGHTIDTRYPIAYEVASNLLQKLMFENLSDAVEHSHKSPKGCTMDFCRSKEDIILKLRTGDICDECIEVINAKGIDKNLIRHLFDIFDGVRQAMTFRSRAELFNQPSRLEVRGHTQLIFLPDLGDLEVRLNPKERSLYLLYLNHTEGIPIASLIDYREELLSLYRRLSTKGDPGNINAAISRLVNPLDNNVNEVISRIRRKFLDTVGTPLVDHYIIAGDRGEVKRIALDRKLVIRNEPKFPQSA